MLSRHQIQKFLALVDAGTFTRAAEAIGVTQPSLSSAIIDLERMIGAQLFDRQRPTVRLTSAGNRLLPVARQIERNFKRAEYDTREPANGGKAFVLGTIPTVPSDLLCGAIASLHHAVYVTEKPSRTLRSELRKGLLDAALCDVSAVPEPQFKPLQLWTEPYVVMASDSHPIAKLVSVEPEDLANEPMIARRSCEYLAETSKFFTGHGVRPRFAFKSRNDDRVMTMISAGIGITVAPASLARDGVAGISLTGFAGCRTIALLARKDDYEIGRSYRDTIVALERRLRASAQGIGLSLAERTT